MNIYIDCSGSMYVPGLLSYAWDLATIAQHLSPGSQIFGFNHRHPWPMESLADVHFGGTNVEGVIKHLGSNEGLLITDGVFHVNRLPANLAVLTVEPPPRPKVADLVAVPPKRKMKR